MSTHTHLEQLFHQLASLTLDERTTRLSEISRSRPELRLELEALLAAHDACSPLDELNPSPFNVPNSDPEPHRALDSLLTGSIGPYRMLSVLGTGGMGVVCLAEQTEPIRRRVAIKVLLGDTVTPEATRRFENERQMLASLRSPHVVKLLEAGSTPDDRPYFVMEYVPGAPITEFCERAGLDVVSRVELFLQLCEALADVHSQGVVHRDVKPSNVLVAVAGGQPVVTLIDFGIAKETSSLSRIADPITEEGRVLGTPEYMSPEQSTAGFGAVDARSDVYSAGMVLAELVGTPTKPPHGYLGRVVLRATHELRTVRYQTVDDLAEDCRRFLEPHRDGSSRDTRYAGHLSRPSWIRVGLGTVATLLLAFQLGHVRDWIGMTGTARVPTMPIASLMDVHDSIRRVPADYPTIQQAIDASTSGEAVIVAPGTYRGNIVLRSGIVLASERGADVTILDGGGSGPVIECSSVDSTTVVRGFHIRHGSADFGGGIRCHDGASPLIEFNVIADNQARQGGGIGARDESFPVIRWNQVLHNRAGYEGGGIYAIDGELGTLVIQNNDIWGNHAGPGRAAGGGVWAGGINVAASRNYIHENTATFAGGGVWGGFKGQKSIYANEFSANACSGIGSDIYVDGGIVRIEENSFLVSGSEDPAGIASGDRGTKVIRANMRRVWTAWMF